MIIYWTDNFKLNKKDLKKAIKKIKNDPECIIFKETEKCYTSYYVQGLNNLIFPSQYLLRYEDINFAPGTSKVNWSDNS